jgi:hypothetical protein
VSLRNGARGTDEVATAPNSRSLAATAAWRTTLNVLWPPALVAVAYAAIGRLGFPSTDEGLMQAYTYRILHGQVPHRDFISPRPLGSALLHIVDFLIPGPLFEVSRVVALCEYVAYAVLFAWLIFEVAPWRWGVVMAAGTAVSVLVNLNIFPLMSWYTVDGLLLVAGGLVVVARGVRVDSRATILAGFVVVGLAALTKQSFVPAPAIAWLLLAPRLARASWGGRLRELFWTGFAGALPTLIFVGVISALGGVGAMRAQLLGAAFIYGRPLLSVWSPRQDLVPLALLVGGTALLTAGIERLRRRSDQGPLLLGLRLALTVAFLGVPFAGQLGSTGNEWGDRILWMAAAGWAVRAVLSRSFDVVGLALLGVAWMSALSYGFAYPNFVAGTLIVYALQRAWSGAPLRANAPRHRPHLRLSVAPVAASILVLLVFGYLFVNVRSQDVYGDRPAAQLTATVDGVSSAFGGIRTNPETARYVVQMTDCIRLHPARYVAVLPENTELYPALSLDDPFPIDWMWPDDMRGSEGRILGTTDRLNASGDYLVLFQTIGEPDLVAGKPIPDATVATPIFAYTPIPVEIYSRLNGRRFTCGSLLAVYAPGHS